MLFVPKVIACFIVKAIEKSETITRNLARSAFFMHTY